MKPVDVVIEATDLFSKVGITCQLRTRDEVRLVDREDMAGPGVIVVAVDRLSVREVAFLQRLDKKPETPMVLVTDASIVAVPRAVADCGVVALLPRAHANADRLVSSILAAVGDSGAGVVPGALVDNMHAGKFVADRTVEVLSSREVDVLTLMADGLDTLGIATRLCYSERTVKNVIHALTSRFKLRSRPHAVAYAMRAGLI